MTTSGGPLSPRGRHATSELQSDGRAGEFRAGLIGYGVLLFRIALLKKKGLGKCSSIAIGCGLVSSCVGEMRPTPSPQQLNKSISTTLLDDTSL